MKKILALSSAVLALFTVEAHATSGSKLTIDQLDEFLTFGNTITSISPAIGARQILNPAEDASTVNGVVALGQALTRLTGDVFDEDVQDRFKLITRAYSADATVAASGLDATLINTIDALDKMTGTRAAYNAVATRAAATFDQAVQGGGADVLAQGNNGGGNALAVIANELSIAGNLRTADLPGAIAANDENDNTFARQNALKSIVYRRLVRNESGAADTNNAATVALRAAQLGAIATAHGVTAANAVPTEDQFTWAMATQFILDVVMDDFR